MRSISFVSDSEGEKLRKFEFERQKKIGDLLIGAVITDIVFDDSMGISNKDISGLFVEKDGEKYHITIDANQFYDCIESRLEITSNGKEVENLITMETPCDTCKKADSCKDRPKDGGWVVDCKVKE